MLSEKCPECGAVEIKDRSPYTVFDCGTEVNGVVTFMSDDCIINQEKAKREANKTP